MPGSAAGQHYREDGSGARRPERQGALPQRVRNQEQQPSVVRMTSGSIMMPSESARQRREMMERQHRHTVGEHPDHDRRHAVERVGGEADGIRQRRVPGIPTRRCRPSRRSESRRSRPAPSPSAIRRCRSPCRRRFLRGHGHAREECPADRGDPLAHIEKDQPAARARGARPRSRARPRHGMKRARCFRIRSPPPPAPPRASGGAGSGGPATR